VVLGTLAAAVDDDAAIDYGGGVGARGKRKVAECFGASPLSSEPDRKDSSAGEIRS
jgi:hypothetical protein